MNIKIIFQYLLLTVLIISFYFFIAVIIFKDKNYYYNFSTWQFPMLLAIYIDVIYKL
jgi:hypothetical protein